MKKIGELMAELGFRQDASDSVKRAFIEGLMRTLPTPPEVVSVNVNPEKKKAAAVPKARGKSGGKAKDPNQLSFFETEATDPSDDDKAVG